ncbi:MAG TPA: carbonic anhydrase [Candidatus Melainabacteria bacterium]|nr:carbonic anhydrase [Candidatus Melainabacteria bacterium]
MPKQRALLPCLYSVIFALSSTAQGFCAESPTAQDALEKLKAGNMRYLSGVSSVPRIDPERREQTATKGQKPIATILGCSDSRVPPELVFDQKFGNLFIIRVAGNVTGTSEIASVEYGVQYLGTPLVVVLGHSACGAVQAAVEKTPLDGKLPKLVELIAPAVDAAKKANPNLRGEKLMEAAVEANVRHQIKELTGKSDLLKKAIETKKLTIVGGIRNINTGSVRWLK